MSVPTSKDDILDYLKAIDGELKVFRVRPNEQLAQKLGQDPQPVPVLRVRAFNHLGPGQTDKFVAPALASRVARAELEGGDVLKVGDLSARRDFTDVRDVVRAYRLLAEKGEPGQVYNVCSGVDLAVQDLADQLVARDHGRLAIALRFAVAPESLRAQVTLQIAGANAHRQYPDHDFFRTWLWHAPLLQPVIARAVAHHRLHCRG